LCSEEGPLHGYEVRAPHGLQAGSGMRLLPELLWMRLRMQRLWKRLRLLGLRRRRVERLWLQLSSR
jgi:hypothetical protein